MPEKRAIVIGAGMAGLVAGLKLADAGLDVTILERAAVPGGKMRSVPVGPSAVEAGPTVFTMRWVFEEICDGVGANLDDLVALKPATLLARHAWSQGERLDLFAEIDRSADAIGAFAGAREADGYRRFCARAAEVFRTLDAPFIRSDRPSPIDLSRRVGFSGLTDLWRIQPFTTLWSALGEFFRDARLRQLFGRYATYCGSSPFDAPATLMLVAHVEQAGVWLVEGGMSALARAFANLSMERGARLRYGADVARLVSERGRVVGVELGDGERLDADIVVCNGDVTALAAGLFGREAVAVGDTINRSERSLSAVTFCMRARAHGFPLAHHSVFFSRDYRDEFDTILRRRRLPQDPTVYICAQDRDEDRLDPDAPERLLVLVNAPADGRERSFPATEIEQCEAHMRRRLQVCGLTLETEDPPTVTSPEGFEALFPATGGALYGRASQGWMASFRRRGARTALPGLYLAGGSVHPGPGVPMAALSGKLAAEAALADLGSTVRSRKAAMSGGTSMR